MSLLTDAWLAAGRGRRRVWIAKERLARRLGRGSWQEWEEGRETFIREHARGRSFADIGGLYRVEGDISFLAEESGATRVTLFDAGDADLTAFTEKRRARGSSVRFVQGDLEDPLSVEEIGVHDLVWCTGVIYHTPNPVKQLMHLRELTRELLYLGTHTIPEVPGVRNACVFYPYVDERSRRAYATAHRAGANCWGIGRPFDDKPMWGHANFWWGITGSALRSMLHTARFEVVEERRPRGDFYREVIARPVEKDPVLPPVTYFRERGRRREEDGTRLPFDTYYEEARRGKG